MLRRPPRSTLFPYTTLFRSRVSNPSSFSGIAGTLLEKAEIEAGMERAVTAVLGERLQWMLDRKSTRLNSSHSSISYAVFCLKKKKTNRSVSERLNHRRFK